MPSKYRPLADYLAGLPAELDTVTLTFPEIEAILGVPLPASSRVRRDFWANAKTRWGGTYQADAWQRAGWRMAAAVLDRPHAVTFTRVDAPG